MEGSDRIGSDLGELGGYGDGEGEGGGKECTYVRTCAKKKKTKEWSLGGFCLLELG